MSALFGQLGVDWKLLLAQGVNFFVLATVLTLFVYRPLLKIVKARQARIAEGMEGAEKAQQRLAEIEALKAARLAEADKQALLIVKDAERDAGARAAGLIKDAEEKVAFHAKEEERILEQKRAQELARVRAEASMLVKNALVRLVKLDPAKIDEKLVRDALASLKEQKAV